MLEIKENPDAVKAGLRAKEVDCDATVDRILELDGKIRTLKTNTETQTAQKNKLAKENGKLFGMKKKAEKEGKDVSELDAAIAANNAQSVQIAEAIEQELAELKTLSDEYRVAMLSLPNLPDPDLKPGGKENNEPLRYFGEPHKFDFTPKHHVDLCEGLGLIDYDRGVKLAGSGFWMYKGMGARLEWALLNYFIDCHIADGYEFILPPHMLEYQCGETAGQFPKFADEVYKISNPTDDRVHYMLPTAEAALCSIYRDEILTEAELPRKFFAYTPCFRREAGSGHADERGMVRGHQFNKVEMFQFTRPEDSDAAFEELVRKAENLVKGLGPVLQIAEGWTVNLPEEVTDTLWKRTDYTWPCTWFTPRCTGEGAFKSAYDMMNNWGANHGAISYGHIGADLITLCSILRIPVCMHNVPEEKIFRPSAWNSFGMDKEGQDFRACKAYGPLYKTIR